MELLQSHNQTLVVVLFAFFATANISYKNFKLITITNNYHERYWRDRRENCVWSRPKMITQLVAGFDRSVGSSSIVTLKRENKRIKAKNDNVVKR